MRGEKRAEKIRFAKLRTAGKIRGVVPGRRRRMNVYIIMLSCGGEEPLEVR